MDENFKIPAENVSLRNQHYDHMCHSIYIVLIFNDYVWHICVNLFLVLTLLDSKASL